VPLHGLIEHTGFDVKEPGEVLIEHNPCTRHIDDLHGHTMGHGYKVLAHDLGFQLEVTDCDLKILQILQGVVRFGSNRGKTSGKLRFAGHVVVASN